MLITTLRILTERGSPCNMHSNLHGKGSSGPGGPKDGSCEISVYMMNQIYKVGINSVVMEDKGDQIVENGPIGVL